MELHYIFLIYVLDHLIQQYPNKGIGRANDAPVYWSLRSPELNQLNYFSWGHLKSMVYLLSCR